MKKRIFILLLLCTTMIFNTAYAVAGVSDPDDPNIRYTGRWDHSTATKPWAYWIGSSIIANFTGTSISATLSASNTDYIRVIIDKNAAESVKIPISSGATEYVLASDLDPNFEHTVEIVKETDAGRLTFHNFLLDGNAALESPPTRPSNKISFYGDSNLAGYSLESEQNQSDRDLRGSYYGYAGIVARMFDAEYENISRSGATLRSLNNAFDRIDYWSRNPAWDFDKFQPDVVVVNLGANDVGRPKNRIKSYYHAFLDDLRAVYPDAHIMLFNGWGWDYDEPANYIHEVIEERPDPNMSWAVFPWVFEQWHGCEYDHAGMAQVLAEHLSRVLGWEIPIPNPRDVMSGFGVGGDVANGSFEKVAPFGGFGWRYSTVDSGIVRIYHPAPDGIPTSESAYDGEYYLRLYNGKSVHQPNPAVDGQVVTVRVWMRGASHGDQAKITIDFRDQEMWTVPLQTDTKTKTLTDGWVQYSMTATAPTGGSKPVYHTRLTLQATSGEYVDFDGVVMSITPYCGDGVCEGDETIENCALDCGCPNYLDCNDSEDCTIDTCELGQCINAWPSCGESDGCCGPGCTDDPDCASTCIQKGSLCTDDSECCTGRCKNGKCR